MPFAALIEAGGVQLADDWRSSPVLAASSGATAKSAGKTESDGAGGGGGGLVDEDAPPRHSALLCDPQPLIAVCCGLSYNDLTSNALSLRLVR